MHRAEPHGKLLIFDTHPIQYRSPVFRALYRKHPELGVRFFNEQFDGTHWWFHEVGKIPKQTWGLSLCDGFPNAVLGTSALGLRGTWRAFSRTLAEEKPAAVVVYGYYLPEHWLLRRLCARRHIPLFFVGETFSSGGSLPRRLIKVPLQRYFFSGVSQFIAIGNKTEAYYRDSFGVPSTRITPAKYCTDVSFFSMPPDQAQAARKLWRASLGIADDAFVSLFVGRLFERKRPWDMIALHDSLSDEARHHTVIVGNGPLEEELKAKARGKPRLHIVGFKNQAETRECYHGSDLLVVPSEYETWGLVVNEAFACELPALVTDTCGVAGDLVLPGQTGFTFPVGDTARAADSVRRLLAEPSLRDKMGKSAREKVAREYSVEQFADAFVEALRRVESGGRQ